MATMADPTDPSGQRLLMADDIKAARVNPLANGFNNLFERFKDFDKYLSTGIANMPNGDAKTNAQNLLDTSNKNVLKAATDLRTAARQQKVYDEITRKFSPTGNLDKIYEYTKPDGTLGRWDPVQWSVEKVNLWGGDSQKINVHDSIAKNPQLREPDLLKKFADHMTLFNRDGEDGKGKGLISNYNPRYAGTNGRHQNIVHIQKEVWAAYGICK